MTTMTPVWPPLMTEPRTLTRQVWDGRTAAGIPAVGKALLLFHLLGGLDLQAWRGTRKVRTPGLLEQPDPDEPGTCWFVQQHLTDWLLAGNALHLVTARDVATGWPTAVKWIPAHHWTLTCGPFGEDRQYWLGGRKVPRADVVHVKRGHDPLAPARGIGIVQQHLRTLDRAALQEESERETLKGGGVPSVAVIAPQSDLTQTDADAAGLAWDQAFAGPGRRPGIFPKDTQVIPLGWSASDSEMVEARKMTLVDIANLCGFDPYWLGSPGSSHNYKSPGPMFLVQLRTAYEPVLTLFEEAWSAAWVPRGQRVRFDRDELTRDDLASTIRAMREATGNQPIFTVEEAREYMGRDPRMPETAHQPPALPVPDDPDPNPDSDPDDEQEDAA